MHVDTQELWGELRAAIAAHNWEAMLVVLAQWPDDTLREHALPYCEGMMKGWPASIPRTHPLGLLQHVPSVALQRFAHKQQTMPEPRPELSLKQSFKHLRHILNTESWLCENNLQNELCSSDLAIWANDLWQRQPVQNIPALPIVLEKAYANALHRFLVYAASKGVPRQRYSRPCASLFETFETLGLSSWWTRCAPEKDAIKGVLLAMWREAWLEFQSQGSAQHTSSVQSDAKRPRPKPPELYRLLRGFHNATPETAWLSPLLQEISPYENSEDALRTFVKFVDEGLMFIKPYFVPWQESAHTAACFIASSRDDGTLGSLEWLASPWHREILMQEVCEERFSPRLMTQLSRVYDTLELVASWSD